MNNAPAPAKKAAQRALPHDTTYTLVRTFHTGGLENACGCENCGKPLTTVAVVQDKAGRTYNVGLDCAATLATVNPFEFNRANYLVGELKKVRSAIAKKQREFKELFHLKSVEFDGQQGREVAVQGWVGGEGRSSGRHFTYYFDLAEFTALIKPALGALLTE